MWHGGAVAHRGSLRRSWPIPGVFWRLGTRKIDDAIIEPAPQSPPSFETHLQPVFELSTRRIVGFEVFNRIVGESTKDFLEKHSLAFSLTVERSMIGQINAAERLLPRGVWLSFNMSRRYIESTSSILEVPKVEDREIYVEVASEESGSGSEELLAIVGDLTLRIPDGYRIAVVGSASELNSGRLSSSISAGMVKISRSWVSGIADDPVRLAHVESAVKAASANGVKVVAEGIERSEDLEALERVGVVFGQGFLLGRPIQIDLGLDG